MLAMFVNFPLGPSFLDDVKSLKKPSFQKDSCLQHTGEFLS